MIESLRIAGLGVIDETQMDFAPGLTVLTGETGAGKTMVLTSLRLLMGDKVTTDLVRAGYKQTEVDGVFEIPPHLRGALTELGIKDETEELIISRTVPRSGRSRAVMDGRPVPLKTLNDITNRLVTVHGQADQWRLRQSRIQLDMVDEFAGQNHLTLLEKYGAAWQEAVRCKTQLDRLHADRDRQEVEIQYLSNLLASIRQFEPISGEEKQLETDIDRLANVADLSRAVAGAADPLMSETGDTLVADMLGTAAKNLRQVVKLDPTLEEYCEQLLVLESEVRGVAASLRIYLAELDEDPDQLARLHQRKAELDSLMKGRATSTDELINWAETATLRLQELTGADADPQRAAEDLVQAQKKVMTIGKELTRSREQSAEHLATSVNDELAALAMQNATFRIKITTEKPGVRGLNSAVMELKSRPDAPFRPLADGVSGGELSRILLALEVARGQLSKPGTFVFDEVDAGVGGRTATEVGRRLAKLAQNQQVLVVTHLPQVASFADRQFVVRKLGNQTVVDLVQGEDRVQEIVRMLGGEEASEAARHHAAELLKEAKNWHNCSQGSDMSAV